MKTPDSEKKPDFTDTHSLKIKGHLYSSVKAVERKILESPPTWVMLAMKARNVAVGFIGLKTENDSEFLKKEYVSENLLKISGCDQHLDFYCELLIENFADHQIIHLKTDVFINNTLGKLYFSVVQHFHPLVVKSLLRSLS